MSSVLKLGWVILLSFFLLNSSAFAQKGGHGKHHGNNGKHKGNHGKGNKVIIVNSYPGPQYHYHHPHPYRKHFYKKAYYPVWGPPVGYYRRWVYFPNYNFYWDNYNGVYVYWTGFFWVKTLNPPPFIINVNFSKERKYELDEQSDDYDNVYYQNYYHRKAYSDD